MRMLAGWPNYHLHTTYCDGKSSVAAYVAELRQRNLRSAGFSSHAPLPAIIDRPWAMRENNLPLYRDEIQQQQKIAKVELELYIGLEVDFFPQLIGPKDFAAQVDYTIGSIHIAGLLADSTPWEVDMSTSLFTRGVNELFDGSYPAAVTHYYSLMREMLINSTPHLLGHLDKIKIHNREKILFEEGSTWYRDQIIETLDLIAQKNVILEVNTRGLYQQKVTEPYPSYWIIREAFARKIPVTISSDAHHASELHLFFGDTARQLLQIGYREIMTLRNGAWTGLPFSDQGIDWS
jgi:histidinol-phosphatase (PHP family)